MSHALTDQDSSENSAPAGAENDRRAPHPARGYTTPDAMRRRNVITGITIITVVVLMIALAILLPTLKS